MNDIHSPGHVIRRAQDCLVYNNMRMSRSDTGATIRGTLMRIEYLALNGQDDAAEQETPVLVFLWINA